MASETKFRVGDWVEVRSKEEVLQTLDQNGRYEEVPFMPQMFEYCGKRFQVYKSAHKACDTANSTGARSVNDVVHLENLRCTGRNYDGCQSACLFYFKEVWLRPAESQSKHQSAAVPSTKNGSPGCTEADVLAATRMTTPGDSDVRYVCQATQLPYASKPLPMWHLGQYLKDYSSGNTRVSEMIEPILFKLINEIINAGIGVGEPFRWAYDVIQKRRGKTPYPWRPARIVKGGKTPSSKLGLQIGEWVRIKKYQEILDTLDDEYRNRGMAFNAELAYYCGGTYRVAGRVDKIMDEKNGRLVVFKNECIVLEGTDCVGRFTRPLFCPRGGYTYWREIWLERVAKPAGEGGRVCVDAVRTIEGISPSKTKENK